jgi:hypothetical protein
MFPMNERDSSEHGAIDDDYPSGSHLLREKQRNKWDQRCPKHESEQHTEGVESNKTPWPSTPQPCHARQRESEDDQRYDVHDRTQGAMLEVAGNNKRAPSHQR